ncbi:MAG: hypothetical protein RLZZ511_2220 [Cyanobacteriota bacterium]|jgi:arachidonate 15-lipoxygenase
MPYSLPQDDLEQVARKQALAQSRAEYVFDHQKFVPIASELRYPMVQMVQARDNSLRTQDWALDVVGTLLQIQANQALYESEVQRGSICKLVWYIRLYKLVTSREQRGFVEKIYKLILGVLQLGVGKTTGKVKSEDILVDAEKGEIEKIDRRIQGMVNDIQKQSKTIDRRAEKLEQRAEKIEQQTGRTIHRARQPNNNNNNVLRDYKDLFQILDLPEIERHVLEDSAFAAQRVAGANPLVLEKISALPEKFPLTAAQYQAAMGDQDDLHRALSEGRLYLADYQILETIVPGQVDGIPKYLCHPIALFAMEATHCANPKLRPVAIQCHQTPSPQNPIFTPPSLSDSEGKRWGWRIAKLMVQIADGNYHELVSHLGRTHLFIEPIVIATHRQLAVSHPLFALLIPHFEGTLFINDAAIRGLINPGGTVDRVLAGTLASSVALSVKGAREFPFAFNQSFLPDVLKRRGLDDPAQLPDYPYRDDALLLWAAIGQWVSDYVQLFYQHDADVQADTELQSWLTEIINEGGMGDIGEITPDDATPKMRSIDYLIKMVTHIIFTSSVQHAAVNFPQSDFMTFMPNMPLAAYREAPQSTEDVTLEHYQATLPSLSQSDSQMDMTYLLGSVYYTQLGNYPENYFQDQRIDQPLATFRQRLQEIELIIDDRNEHRASFYDTLKPSNIPQSINI